MTTYSQLYLQIVFSVKHRQKLIDSSWETSLYKYITEVIKRRGQKLLAINGMPDHIHIFISCRATINIPDLVRDVKRQSTEFIKEERFLNVRFQWQEGYGVFSYKKSDQATIINYIKNQKEHHNKETFENEFVRFLIDYDITYNPKYLFD